jgi:hypothetical protein
MSQGKTNPIHFTTMTKINNASIYYDLRVRLPPPPIGSSSQDGSASSVSRFTEAEEIEVFSRASDQESCGWWRAVIKMIKGDFHVVEYLGWETTYTEVRFSMLFNL